MALSNKTEDLERALHSYTSHATALQLLPATAKNAQGRDFKISVDKVGELDRIKLNCTELN